MRKLVAGLLMLLIAVAGVNAADGQFRGKVRFTAPDGSKMDGVRCAMVDVSPTLEVLKGMRSVAADNRSNLAVANVSVPIAFHVITDSSGAGDVPMSQINSQVDVLNLAYAPHGFSFTLFSVDVTANNSWYRAGPDTFEETQMKNSLAIDPANTLNVYTSSPTGGLLGWATFPWYYDESDTRHGVVILNESVPGGSAAPFNEGDTLTHEVGHYLGLFHTFQGGCQRPGDYLRDTPAERTPTSGCPASKDTCAQQQGLDPIHNYMDYSDDFCMTEFTRMQRRLMNWATSRYRPGLMTAN